METLIIKRSLVNPAHILTSGHFDAILSGSSDSFTEQRLTPYKIPIGSVRGTPKILLQMELISGSSLVDKLGVCDLRTKEVSQDGFMVVATHNLPVSASVNVRVHWFAFGYEGEASPAIELTRQNNQIVPLVYSEAFSNITGTITLSRMPIHDATLIVWSDRVAMFYGRDFTAIDNVLTLVPPLTGNEDVVVTFTTRTAEVL
jgi:hypothetical protein